MLMKVFFYFGFLVDRNSFSNACNDVEHEGKAEGVQG